MESVSCLTNQSLYFFYIKEKMPLMIKQHLFYIYGRIFRKKRPSKMIIMEDIYDR